MKFYLIVAKGSRKGFPVPITFAKRGLSDVGLFFIGSDADCQLRNKKLRDKHCAIVAREGKVFIQDLGLREESKPKSGDKALPVDSLPDDLDNRGKTLVNDSLLPPGTEWPLHGGDRIAFGGLEFMIQYREKPLSQRDLEEWAAKCLDVNSDRDLFDENADQFHLANNASDAAQNIIERLTAQRGVVMGRLRIGRESGVTTVRFNDTMLVEEAEITYIDKELRDLLNKPNLRVLLDCKNVKRMSTAGVSMILEFNRWVKQFGNTLALCRVRADIRSILQVLDSEEIPIFHDKKAAYMANW
jgi:anti-anti-sigma regulatory factor